MHIRISADANTLTQIISDNSASHNQVQFQHWEIRGGLFSDTWSSYLVLEVDFNQLFKLSRIWSWFHQTRAEGPGEIGAGLCIKNECRREGQRCAYERILWDTESHLKPFNRLKLLIIFYFTGDCSVSGINYNWWMELTLFRFNPHGVICMSGGVFFLNPVYFVCAQLVQNLWRRHPGVGFCTSLSVSMGKIWTTFTIIRGTWRQKWSKLMIEDLMPKMFCE